jgi:hypothetical protein
MVQYTKLHGGIKHKNTFYMIFTLHFLYSSQITHTQKCTIFHFILFIQLLHMFRPLQGHLQGTHKLHSLHIVFLPAITYVGVE